AVLLGVFLLASVFLLWQSERAATDLILRIKEDYDGAEPSGNSVAILSLLRLAAISGQADFKAKAEQSLRLFAEKLQQAPQFAPLMLLALDYWLEEPRRVVIVGDYTCASTRSLLDAAHSVYQPNKVVLGNHGPVEPFVKSLPADDEASRAYLCSGTACQPPTRIADVVKAFCRGESKPAASETST
ncbi:MAG: hypothetical protein HY043_24265, partial [Verrucomicrobia bacterium]|nr:hypothetical protein [Verrucomicrobiota bacterium]